MEDNAQEEFASPEEAEQGIADKLTEYSPIAVPVAIPFLFFKIFKRKQTDTSRQSSFKGSPTYLTNSL